MEHRNEGMINGNHPHKSASAPKAAGSPIRVNPQYPRHPRSIAKQKVTIGKVAQIAEMSRFQFETALSENKIPISNLGLEDLMEDIQKFK